MMSEPSKHPVIYACSGCSNVAQLANRIALQMDRSGKAEMSCISGVGGGVAPLVRIATSGRPIIALDGCQLHCVKACLAKQDVEPTHHLTFSELGINKRSGCEANELQFKEVLSIVEGLEPLGSD
jgi:uncharacterized metal-binding protein